MGGLTQNCRDHTGNRKKKAKDSGVSCNALGLAPIDKPEKVGILKGCRGNFRKGGETEQLTVKLPL